MVTLALKIFPVALLVLSAAVLLATPRRYPFLGALMLFNCIRSWEYLAACCAANPRASIISALLILLASEESLRSCSLRPWASVFAASLGVVVGAMAVLVGNAASPLKIGLHIAAGFALAVGMLICGLNGRRALARPALMLAYVIGAVLSSKQSRPDEWWSILATESIHCAALTGLFVAAVLAAPTLPQRES